MARRFALTGAALVPALLAPAATSSAETVTSLADSGPGSLRAAIANAAPGETLDFQPGLEGTIELATVLEVSKDLRIDGPGARRLSISGTGATRVLHISGAGTEVEIDDVTIREGATPGGEPLGGGVLVTGGDRARLVRVALVDNEASSASNVPLGGGIAVVAGHLELVDSTVAGNRASGGGGGGLFVGVPATFDVSGSTIAGNSASGGAGLLVLDGAGDIRATTLAGNTAGTVGHAIGASAGAAVTVARSLITGNGADDEPACDGPVLSGGGNVVDTSCFAVPQAGDSTGAAAPVGPLADNGGPTDTVMPLLGNPALDHFAAACAAADQRGTARPQGPACDAGAVEAVGARLEPAGPVALDTTLVGRRSPTGSTTLANAGEVAAVIAAIGVTGPAAAEIESAAVANACADGQVLEPGKTCMLAAVLAPATAGVKQAAFTVDLAAPAQDVAVAVTGRGEAPAQAVPPAPPVVAVPAPDPATAPQAAARLLGTSTRARERGRFAVRLRCVTIAAPRCKGALTIALGPRRLTRGFSIAAGRKAVVRLRLSRADRRRLTRRRSLRSAVTVVTAQPDGSRRTTHEAVLRLKRARRR